MSNNTDDTIEPALARLQKQREELDVLDTPLPDNVRPFRRSARPAAAPLSFGAIADKNRENEERLRKERLAANKGVLRSFRIKN